MTTLAAPSSPVLNPAPVAASAPVSTASSLAAGASADSPAANVAESANGSSAIGPAANLRARAERRSTFEPSPRHSSAREASIVGFRSPMQNDVGRVTFEWEKPGDVIPFEVTVKVEGDPSKVSAELHTNANHNDDPDRYDDLPMSPTGPPRNGLITFRVEVPIHKLGNYRATPKISIDGVPLQWGREAGIPDLRFRPRVEAHNGLNIRELNIHNVNSNGRGTIEDLLGSGSPQENGKYTLEFLKKEGVNALWVMPPFKRSLWEGRYPGDDAGSPYAAKSFFQVDPAFSSEALAVQARGGSEAEVEQIANAAFKRLVDHAHKLGMKVIVDVALNHVGHNFEFTDYDVAAREVRENDYSQLVSPNSEQGRVIAQRLADPNLPDYAEYVAPELLYASRTGDRRGAQSVHDTMAGGGQWFDTKQLKTGGRYGPQNPDGGEKVVDYLTRVMQFWVAEMGVDGFRLDHLSGLPDNLLEGALNRVQATSDQLRGGEPLYFTGEDFEHPAWTSSMLDSIQDTWLRNALLAEPSANTIRQLLLNDHFKRRELLNLNSHDETRFDFRGDWRAHARMNSTLQLLGGTTATVAGDELGETEPMAFKQFRPVKAIANPTPEGKAIEDCVRRAGLARENTPVLKDDNTLVLRQRGGGDDPDILALARVPDAERLTQDEPVFVFSNFNDDHARENVFTLDAKLLPQIDPSARYQVRDLLSDHGPLWSQPKTGKELLDQGLFVKLSPYQVQALQLTRV